METPYPDESGGRGIEAPPAFPLAWNDETLDGILGEMAATKPCGSTGIVPLDEMLGGGLWPDVHVLAAEPGAGKTTLALQVADWTARHGSRKVVFASMEMSAAQVLAKSISRLASEQGREPLTARRVMRMGQADMAAIQRAVGAYRAEIAPNIATVDRKLTVGELAELMDAMPATEPKPVLVVDYLQIMPAPEGDQKTDYQHHTSNMRGLCEIAKRNRTPVLVVSSKNRSGRDGRSLGSLSGSSDIEYGASVVMFLEVDGDSPSEREQNAALPKRPVTLHVRKNRFGAVGAVPLVFLASEGRYIERVCG